MLFILIKIQESILHHPAILSSPSRTFFDRSFLLPSLPSTLPPPTLVSLTAHPASFLPWLISCHPVLHRLPVRPTCSNKLPFNDVPTKIFSIPLLCVFSALLEVPFPVKILPVDILEPEVPATSHSFILSDIWSFHTLLMAFFFIVDIIRSTRVLTLTTGSCH